MEGDEMDYRLAICDDEIVHINNIRAVLPDLEFDIYTDPRLLLSSGKEYDVVFLDIMMPQIDGISVARELRETNDDLIIVFITSKIEFMQTGYEVKAFRYLLKDQITAGLKKVWDDIEIELAANKNEYFTYEFEREKYQLPCREIIYFESKLRRVLIHTKNKTHNFYGHLDDIKTNYPLFTRFHKSYLVNKKHIRNVSADRIVMSNGDVVPISRKYKREL